jgi:hypothetical protein
MSEPISPPGDEVPAEDWAEQGLDAGPSGETSPAASRTPVTRTVEANEADLAEQELTVEFDDER